MIVGTTKRFYIVEPKTGKFIGSGAVHKGFVTMYSTQHKVRVPFTTFEEAYRVFVAGIAG